MRSSDTIAPHDQRPDMPVPTSGPVMQMLRNSFTGETTTLPTQRGKLVEKVCQFLDAGGIDHGVMRHSDILINGRMIPREKWLETTISDTDRVRIVPRVRGGGGGGKNPLATIIQVVAYAVAAVLSYFTPWLSPLWFGLATGIAVGASLLFPVKNPSLSSSDDQGAQNFIVESTQNSVRLYEAQELVTGTIRTAPSYAANGFSTFEGNNQWWHGLYQVSAGTVHVPFEDLRIGDTPFSSYVGAEAVIYEGWKGEPLRWLDTRRQEVSESVTLSYGSAATHRETPLGVTRIILFIQFPNGLFWSKKAGGYESDHAIVGYRWRVKGTSAWSQDQVRWDEEQTRSFVRTITIPVAQSGADIAYEYELWRVDDERRYDRYIGNTVFAGAQYWFAEKSIIYREGFAKTLIEIRLKANEQLSGAVNQLNCIAKSYGLVPDGAGNWSLAITKNPAALALHVMTNGELSKRPYPKERIDWQAAEEFYHFCNNYGFEYAAVRSDGERRAVVVEDILRAGLGGLTTRNGKYSFAWDDPGSSYTDTATPFFCWGFEITRQYPIYPIHGLRVEFPNRDKDWQLDERIVYADGYNDTNAENIIAWTPSDGNRGTSGVDSSDLIYKHARMNLARIVHRPETITWYTDWRSLDYTKGKKIAVSYDTYLVGNGGGNVMSHILDDTGLCAGIIINQNVSLDAGKTYIVRDTLKGSERTWTLRTTPGSANELYFSYPIPVNTAPKLMIPVSVGEAGRDTMICTITEVQRMEDYTAKITAMPSKGAEILASIDGPIPAWDSKVTIPNYYQRGKPNPPVVTGVRSDESILEYLLGAYVPRIGIGFLIVDASGVTVSQVLAQYRKVGDSVWANAGYVGPLEGEIFISGVVEQETYEIRLAAVSEAGIVSAWTAAFTETVVGRTTPPPAPISLRLNGNMLYWDMPEDTPVDVIGWQVWMAMDATDDFAYALNISRGYVTERMFDLTAWSGHARRVWVRTIDALELVSTPVSVGINLGDVLVDNVVVDFYEGKERGWPGSISQGHLAFGALAADAEAGFWDSSDIWGNNDFWGAGAAMSMVYETGMVIPHGIEGCDLSIAFDAPNGGIAIVEYRFITSGPFWPELDLWGTDNFWNMDMTADWEPMPDKLPIGDQQYIQIRVTTTPAIAAVIEEMRWVFDVEDEIDYANDLYVPATGIRVPLTKSFRWIKNISFGQEYHAGTTAVRAVYVDKGVIVDGAVVEGPMIYCRDGNNNNATGIVDVTMQGAKGV